MKVHKIIIPMTAISLLGTFIAYLFLPDDIPVLWNSKGSVLSFFKGAAFITALLPLAAYLVRAVPLKINPKSDHYDKHQKTYETAILAIALVVAAIHWTLLYHSLKNEIGIPFITKMVLGIFIVLFGNFAGQVRQNIFTGLRNPWEYSSDKAWKKARKAGSYLIVGAGFATGISAFYPRYVTVYAMILIIAGVVLYNIAYSYLEFSKIRSEKAIHEESR